MHDQRAARGRTYVKRGAGVVLAAGFAVAASGCFLPGTGTLNVTVIEHTSEPVPFDFDKDTYVVPHGEVDAAYFAPVGSPIPHTLKLREVDGTEAIPDTIDLAVSPGPTGTDADAGTFDVPAGTYELYCDVAPLNAPPGLTHADLGMTATLIAL